jgi:eukaryotic-like serine/threonine-protein kinase
VDFGKQWQGQTVGGHFPLEQYLGGSDSSAVFLTRLQGPAKTKAAIKLMPSGPDAEDRLADWRRAAQLSHPHLIRVFECGRSRLAGKDLLYVVSEYADEHLGQVVPQRALTSAEADAMLLPALEALAYLHDRGLVHGHICPSNILAVNDQVKISSDGVQAAGVPTRKWQATPYDAPELTSGKLSPAADVWSLGVTLTETLTQRFPDGKSNLPQPYGEIARHCLEKDPAKRWSVREIARAIQLDLPTPAGAPQEKPKPQPERRVPVAKVSAPVSKRPNRTVPLVVVLGVVALALAIVLTFKALHQPAPKEYQEVQSAPASPPTGSAATQPGTNQPGAVLHRVMPTPAESALRTIHGRIKIRIRAAADAAGNVANARFVSAGPSQYFARYAMEAAKQWKFTPPVENGRATSSEWNLLFEFTNGGVQAVAEPTRSSR